MGAVSEGETTRRPFTRGTQRVTPNPWRSQWEREGKRSVSAIRSERNLDATSC